MLKNILLNIEPVRDVYKAKRGRGGDFKLPPRNRFEHGNMLRNQYEDILKKYNENHIERSAAALKTIDGVYIQFESKPGFDLKTESLEDIRAGIRLLNIKDDDKSNNEKVTIATIFVPIAKTNNFLKKLDEYLDPNLEEGKKPRNKVLIESIENIKTAYIDSFVTTKNTVITNDKKWYEIWLSFEFGAVDFKNELRVFAESNNLLMLDEYLEFSERCVCLINANRDDLIKMISEVPNVAEIRATSSISTFFMNLSKVEQEEWIDELKERVNYVKDNYAISVLDSGIQTMHPLIFPAMVPNGEAVYDASWGLNDTPLEYHGTAMAGICVYDSIASCLESSAIYDIEHQIENGKIISNVAVSRHLYGYVVAQVVSSLIINNPAYTRVYCMAVTEKDICYDGRPSSWSAYMDNICFSRIEKLKKLFVVSAGNCNDPKLLMNYPTINRASSIESPAQAWNVLTIGGITFKDLVGDKTLAKIGELSPFTRTSFMWDNRWPIKPEVVFEAGNAIVDSNVALDHQDLSDLTTEGNFVKYGFFRPFNATSLATAKASNFAIRLQALYPNYWPETIRALIVQSASWTPQLEKQFLPTNPNKKDYRDLLRTCGYGHPNYFKASQCRNNSVNLIVQSQITPYELVGSDIKLKEYALFEVPWPKELLLLNSDKKASLKITLSYFIESNPGELGWKDKYKYASCGLRFSINGILPMDMFKRTVSNYISADDESKEDMVDVSTNVKWKYGTKTRNVGSIHSDIWETTAGQLAESRYIAVYPVAGWWKTKKREKKYDEPIRFSLVVSLNVDGEIDIYNKIISLIETDNKILINN